MSYAPRRLPALVLLLLLPALPAWAQGMSAAKAPNDSEAALIATGKKIFHGKGLCYSCHGDKLEGGPVAPSLRGGTWRHIDGSYDAILGRVKSGYTGTAMVSHPGGISDAEAAEVASYVFAVSHGKTKP